MILFHRRERKNNKFKGWQKEWISTVDLGVDSQKNVRVRPKIQEQGLIMTRKHGVNLGKSTRFLWNSERKDNLKSKLRSRSTGSV
jgi:hypothetical protein